MNFRVNIQKTKRIAFFEYRRHVWNVRFWVGLLGFPLMMIALFVAFVAAILFSRDTSPVGVVGPPGLNLAPPPGVTYTYTYRLFSTEDQARAALLTHAIQAYYVVSPDHSSPLPITRLIYLIRPPAALNQEFGSLMRRSLLAEFPPERAARVTRGALVILQSGSITAPAQTSALLKMFASFMAIYGLLALMTGASGYMINTISDERNNRILEVLITSVSHDQLMTGKLVGQLAVILTQLLVWAGVPALGFLLVMQLRIPLLSDLFTSVQLAVFVVSGLLTLTLVSVLLGILGVTVMDTAEGQFVSYFFNFCTLLPVLLYQSLTVDPSGPIAMILTFFPLTSASALLVRMSFSSVPAWQVILSLTLLAAAARASFWLAGRLFWRSLQERPRRKLSLAGLKSFSRRIWRPRHA